MEDSVRRTLGAEPSAGNFGNQPALSGWLLHPSSSTQRTQFNQTTLLAHFGPCLRRVPSGCTRCIGCMSSGVLSQAGDVRAVPSAQPNRLHGQPLAQISITTVAAQPAPERL